MVQRPNKVPQTIINPMGTFNAPIKNKGPGDGGTNEFAITPPAMTDKANSR